MTNRNPWVSEIAIVGILAGAFLALLLLVHRSAPTAFDRRFADDIQAIPWGRFAVIPEVGSELGGGIVGFYIAPALVAAAFVALKRWRLLALLGAVYVLHFVMISPKLFITAYRPSPDFGVDGAGGLASFPSGHVQWAVSFYGFLAYLAWRAAPARLRVAVLPVYGVIALGTMLGRIELGRHWPVDTIAGAIAGLLVVRLVIILHAWPRKPDPTAPAG